MTRTKLLPLLILLAGLSAACASIPSQEMSDARQAVQAAHEANADKLAPEPLNEAQKLLDEARTALGQGDYSAARAKAIRAKEAAIRAREQALGAQPE
jgi:flagellar basal body L-ring protein FlgH